MYVPVTNKRNYDNKNHNKNHNKNGLHNRIRRLEIFTDCLSITKTGQNNRIENDFVMDSVMEFPLIITENSLIITENLLNLLSL